MSKIKIISILVALVTTICLTALIGCSGGTSTDRSGADYEDTEFVATEDSVGSIDLWVRTTDMPVSGVSGFIVSVRNSSGAPVQNIQIACDTELGLALIEPSTGSEMTDSHGQMSGKVGCEVPGSLILGCRLPIGVNRRKFVTIKCRGPIPDGFFGFPGAAGGGLGYGTGGVAATED